MPSLFKKQITRYVDAAGRRVPKGTLGTRRVRHKSRKYYAKYRDANGDEQTVALFSDKAASQARLADLIRRAERRQAGLHDPLEQHNKRPLRDHLADYRRHLETKGGTEDHVEVTIARIKAVLDGCRFERLADLAAQPVAQWLAELRRSGRTGEAFEPVEGVARTYEAIAEVFGVSVSTVTYWRRQGAPISPRRPNDLAAIQAWRRHRSGEAGGVAVATSNHYLRAMKSFAHWLLREQRILTNPFAHVSALNAETDRRRERRVLSEEEFNRLIHAARTSEMQFRGLSGPDRAMLYVVAANSGLRASELASLSETSLDLESRLPAAAVAAAYSKRRRSDLQPLRADLAERLAAWLEERSANDSAERLWPGTWQEDAAEMLRGDLARAAIPYRDEAGHVFDFHSLRHHFITQLASAGVHPKVAQQLARHSSITLTMNRYTHLDSAAVAGALDNLPALPTTAPSTPPEDENPRFQVRQSSSVVAPMVALTFDPPCPGVALVDGGVEDSARDQESQKPLGDKGFDAG